VPEEAGGGTSSFKSPDFREGGDETATALSDEPMIEDDAELKDGSFELCVNTVLPCTIEQVHRILWMDLDRTEHQPELPSFWQAVTLKP
jgi:hypothetical protein